MRKRLFAGSAALLTLAAVGFAQPAAQPATPYNLITPAALDAFRRFDAAEGLARRVYDSAVSEAAAKLSTDLRQLQERFTRSGNLDEALKLRTALNDLQQAKLPARVKADVQDTATAEARAASTLSRVLPGSKWKHTDGWTMTLSADQSAASSHHAHLGTWAIFDGKTLRLSVSMNNCTGIALTISPDGTRLLDAKGELYFVLVKKN